MGVGQPASITAAGSRSVPCEGPPFGPSCTQGVGHPVQPLADVRGADGTSRERDRPAGVRCGFQVVEYKIEPDPAVSAATRFARISERFIYCRALIASAIFRTISNPHVPTMQFRAYRTTLVFSGV